MILREPGSKLLILREMGSTTYDVLLQYLAFAIMFYSLLSFYNELWFR